jgi:predicted porin
MKKTFAALALAAAFAPFASVHAATISYTDSKPTTTTNWTDVLSFAKFDSSLGTLTSIRFDLSGAVQASAMPKAWIRRRPR